MKRRDILFLLISSVVLVLAWIVFSIIHQLVSSTISDSTTQSITPIQPTFDVALINELKTREKVAPLFSAGNTSSQSASPTPTLPPIIVISSPSATPTVTVSRATPASQGGTTQ